MLKFATYSANTTDARIQVTIARTAPALTQRNLGCCTFGVAQYKIATTRTTKTKMTGQRAIFHTVRAVSPRPMASPTEVATGPLTASMSPIAATMINAISVTSNMIGRSFQIGRPSSTSYMRFIARPNAPTYPDADHNAPASPRIRANPALGAETSCWTGPRRVSTADEGPRSSMIFNTASVVFWPCPNRPSSDTIASNAGNSDNTA